MGVEVLEEKVVIMEVKEVGGVDQVTFAKHLLEPPATLMNTTLSKSLLMRIYVIGNVHHFLTKPVETMTIVPTESASIK